MEDNTNSAFFTFDSPKEQSSIIKVIGVGGGGGNAVNHMFREGINGVDFIVCNTDMKALNSSPVPNKISLGNLGAGNKPEVARQAALDKADDIRESLSHNTKMLFVTAGMGGGTGTGAAPVIAEIAKSIDLEDENIQKILVVAIVTLPFSFEGKRRRLQAQEGIKELSRHVDSIIVINNDKLRAFGNMTMSQAFGMADDILLTAAKGIAEIITNNAYVNIDLNDVNTVMQRSGTALMGAGSGSGENRALEAITAATTSVLLDDNDISGAKNVLLYFSYSAEHELTMDEQAEITDFILEKTDGTADFIWGAGVDDSLGEELRVILIATGFEKNKETAHEPTVTVLDEPIATKEAPRTSRPDAEGITIISRDEASPEPKAASQPEQPKAEAKPEMPATPMFQPEAKIEPQPQPAPQPAAPAAPADEKKNIIIWTDEEEEEAPAARTRNIRAGSDHFSTEIDATVGDIALVQHPEPEPAPVDALPQAPAPVAATPQPAPEFHTPAPAPAASRFDEKTAMDRAERIRYINEMLHSNPNGAEYVQSIPVGVMAGEAYPGGTHSSEREATATALRADGSLAKNPYLYGAKAD